MESLENQIADLEKLLLAKNEALRRLSGIVQSIEFGYTISRIAPDALSLTPDSVRAKYVTVEELAACQRERDDKHALAGNYSERMQMAIVERNTIRQKHVEVLAELERVKECLTDTNAAFEENQRQERQSASEAIDSLRAQLSAAQRATAFVMAVNCNVANPNPINPSL